MNATIRLYEVGEAYNKATGNVQSYKKLMEWGITPEAVHQYSDAYFPPYVCVCACVCGCVCLGVWGVCVWGGGV